MSIFFRRIQVIPVEAPGVDASRLPVELMVGAPVVWADESTEVAAPVEVSKREIVVAELGAVKDDASELCAAVVVVPAVEVLTWEVGSALKVLADVVAPENG